MDIQKAANYLHGLHKSMMIHDGPMHNLLAPSQIEDALHQLWSNKIVNHVDVQQVISIAKAACSVLGPVCAVVKGMETNSKEEQDELIQHIKAILLGVVEHAEEAVGLNDHAEAPAGEHETKEETPAEQVAKTVAEVAEDAQTLAHEELAPAEEAKAEDSAKAKKSKKEA